MENTPHRRIRKAEISDIPTITAMYAHSKQLMRESGNMRQWAGSYPDLRQIHEDLQRQVSFLMEENGKPVATFAFIIGEDPTYAHIEDGQWPENTPQYGTLHRIARAPGAKHTADDCIAWCRTRISCLRIDTHADNPIMQHILLKNGFSYCGIIRVADGTPRLAYQRHLNEVTPSLREHIHKEIIPRYAFFDRAHQVAHVLSVIAQSLLLARHYPEISLNQLYTVAAYHDTGLAIDREKHHLHSGRILREDTRLQAWFRPEEIECMAEAAEDHRASAKRPPRSLYGKIVAEADRQLDQESIVRRCLQFALSESPRPAKDACWQHVQEHLHEKYAKNGYLQLWIPESPNAGKLAQLQALIEDEQALRSLFERIYTEEENKQ